MKEKSVKGLLAQQWSYNLPPLIHCQEFGSSHCMPVLLSLAMWRQATGTHTGQWAGQLTWSLVQLSSGCEASRCRQLSIFRKAHPVWYSNYDFRFSAVVFTLIEPGLLLSGVVSLLPWFDCLLGYLFRT